jgi:hypothetical protein
VAVVDKSFRSALELNLVRRTIHDLSGASEVVIDDELATDERYATGTTLIWHEAFRSVEGTHVLSCGDFDPSRKRV